MPSVQVGYFCLSNEYDPNSSITTGYWIAARKPGKVEGGGMMISDIEQLLQRLDRIKANMTEVQHIAYDAIELQNNRTDDITAQITTMLQAFSIHPESQAV